MAEPMNIRAAVLAREITNRDVHRIQTQNGRGKQQLEVAERIEVAEIAPPRAHPLIIVAGDQLGAAKRVAQPGIQHPT